MSTHTRMQKLILEKDAIEKEMKELSDVLETQKGVGMEGALVDNEGYPRNDIDIYAVRTSRHRIKCLQNDHKDIMKQIEEGLHELHAEERNKAPQQAAEIQQSRNGKEIADDREAFAVIDVVTPGSPAAKGGLEAKDLLVKFGSVTMENFENSLQNIANVVKHSQGRIINITVVRQGSPVHLGVVPQIWKGKGLLGCNIVPLKNH